VDFLPKFHQDAGLYHWQKNIIMLTMITSKHLRKVS